MLALTIIERRQCSCSWPMNCGGTDELRCQDGECQCGCGHSRPCGGCEDCEDCEDCDPCVCPGCYAVGAEPHGPGCIERERLERDIYGGDDDTLDDEDEESDWQ